MTADRTLHVRIAVGVTTVEGNPVSFADAIVRAFGRRGYRALIRARQRYNAAKPNRARMRALHIAYSARRRRRW